MSKKLEKVLECLINEESDRASELLHDVIVEKARTIYQDLVNEADEDLDEEVVEEEDAIEEAKDEDCDDDDKEEIEENFDFAEADDEDEAEVFGGDETEDFADDIEVDTDAEAGEFGEEAEEEVEDRVEDLEAALADLRAEFDSLMGDEVADIGEPDPYGIEGDVELDDMGMEPEMEEGMFEGIQDSVAAPSNTEDASDKKSMFSQAPSKKLDGADPVDFAGGDEKGGSAESAKEETPTDNVDVDQKPVAKPAMSKEGQTDSDALFTKEVK